MTKGFATIRTCRQSAPAIPFRTAGILFGVSDEAVREQHPYTPILFPDNGGA